VSLPFDKIGEKYLRHTEKIPLYLPFSKGRGFSMMAVNFFSTENVPGGGVYHSAVRVIIRGTAVLYVY
jgi:hypothetical protein